ncbi:MAG: hypothetical protein KC766_15090, partial [Myxococcales bacterium]|nr:hypothetical protein [Myxococcales bacterium]
AAEPPAGLSEAISSLFARLGCMGDTSDPAPLDELQASPGAVQLPAWVVSLLTTQPLVGVQVGVRLPEFEREGLGPVMFEWSSTRLVLEMNRDAYPGMHVYPHGYLAVGLGTDWAGNVLLLDLNHARVPVFELWHDVSQDPEVLVGALRSRSHLVECLSDSLVSFLHSCETAPPRP